MMDLPDSPLSLWLAEYGEYTPEPALAGDVDVDVAVIGGGYLGMSTSVALKRRDPSLKVAVLEAETIGYGASGRNGSFAMTVIGLGFGTTAMLRGNLTRECPFVNRRVIGWPREPLATAVKHTLRGYLRAEDAFNERTISRAH